MLSDAQRPFESETLLIDLGKGRRYLLSASGLGSGGKNRACFTGVCVCACLSLNGSCARIAMHLLIYKCERLGSHIRSATMMRKVPAMPADARRPPVPTQARYGLTGKAGSKATPRVSPYEEHTLRGPPPPPPPPPEDRLLEMPCGNDRLCME